MKDDSIEKKVLKKDYEQELRNIAAREIEEAKKQRERKKKIVTITDVNQLDESKRFDRQAVYYVFNRRGKTESFVNGVQAENLMRYTDDYIVKFSHRSEEI